MKRQPNVEPCRLDKHHVLLHIAPELLQMQPDGTALCPRNIWHLFTFARKHFGAHDMPSVARLLHAMLEYPEELESHVTLIGGWDYVAHDSVAFDDLLAAIDSWSR